MPGGTTNAAWPREPRSGSTDGRDDVHVRDAAVGGVRLLPVEHPLVGRLVVAGAGAHRGDVGTGLRLGRAERGDLRVGGVAEALRHPLEELLGRAVAEDGRDREAGAHDGHRRCRRRPRTVPRARSAGTGRSGRRMTLARNSKPYRPIFAASWMIGHGVASRSSHSAAGRADDVGGEAVHPVAQVPLLLVQVERELRHRQRLRDVEQVTDLGGQAEVALGLELAGHEQHHRVGVAGDDLEEVGRRRRSARASARGSASATACTLAVRDDQLVGVGAAVRRRRRCSSGSTALVVPARSARNSARHAAEDLAQHLLPLVARHQRRSSWSFEALLTSWANCFGSIDGEVGQVDVGHGVSSVRAGRSCRRGHGDRRSRWRAAPAGRDSQVTRCVTLRTSRYARKRAGRDDCPAACASSRCSTPPWSEFARLGFHAASMDDIAARAGVSQADGVRLPRRQGRPVRGVPAPRGHPGDGGDRRRRRSGISAPDEQLWQRHAGVLRVRRRAPRRLVGALPAGAGPVRRRSRDRCGRG